MKLNVLNPPARRKKRTSKKSGKRKSKAASKKKAAAKKPRKAAKKATKGGSMAKRKSGKRKSTKRASTKRAAPKRSTGGKKRKRRSSRRRTTTTTTKSVTRRSNPSVMSQVKGAIPGAAGALLAGIVSEQVGRRFGRGSLTGGGIVQTSNTMGVSWSLPQYAAVLGVAMVLPMAKRFVGRGPMLQRMQQSMIEMAVNKAMFTEALPKAPEPIQTAFGDADAVDGDIAYTPDGQGWIQQGGRWVALQGALVDSSPLDGAVVEASPLDGAVVNASPLDGYGRRGNYDPAKAYRDAYAPAMY